METNEDLYLSNSNFRELKREELDALSKEEQKEYFNWYKKFINIKFQENSERTNKSLEKLEKIIDDL